MASVELGTIGRGDHTCIHKTSIGGNLCPSPDSSRVRNVVSFSCSSLQQPVDGRTALKSPDSHMIVF